MILPPLELLVDPLGRRCVPLASLIYVLEAAQEDEGATLGLLLEAAKNAADAPLPGLTPMRADQIPGTSLPWLELAAPERTEQGWDMHPGAADDK